MRRRRLYDISSALPSDDSKGHKLQLAMKIGGDYRLRRADTVRAWNKTARELGLAAEGVRDRAIDLADGVADAFGDAAAEPEIVALESPLPGALVKLIADRAERCARILRRGDLSDDEID